MAVSNMKRAIAAVSGMFIFLAVLLNTFSQSELPAGRRFLSSLKRFTDIFGSLFASAM
ncbi:hypothetical protein D9M72_303940 [compost metagenome]